VIFILEMLSVVTQKNESATALNLMLLLYYWNGEMFMILVKNLAGL